MNRSSGGEGKDSEETRGEPPDILPGGERSRWWGRGEAGVGEGRGGVSKRGCILELVNGEVRDGG